MRLPFEIRTRIYHYLFTELRLARVPNDGRKPVQPPAEPTGYPPILVSNHAIRDEALSLYYQLVDFRLIWNQDYESIYLRRVISTYLFACGMALILL